jgi:hypothetical protein
MSWPLEQTRFYNRICQKQSFSHHLSGFKQQARTTFQLQYLISFAFGMDYTWKEESMMKRRRNKTQHLRVIHR